MFARVTKWGNSLAVRIPRAFAAEAGIEDGSTVDVSLERGDIRLRPIRSPRYRLEDLLAEVTPENLHGEVDFGPPVGREAW